MFELSTPDTFWLDVTNVALGLVTLACVCVVLQGLVGELRFRLRRRAQVPDDHAFLTPDLGLTMADGGERVEEEDPARKRE